MYHYVRPLAASSFPRLRALEASNFEKQLDYLKLIYNVISPRDLAANLLEGEPLPTRPCLLTFDDGYIDHYRHVFPALQIRKLTGLFFAPKQSLIMRTPLEVNKIQFVIASCDNPNMLSIELEEFLHKNGAEDTALLRENFMAPNRFDGAQVGYFKRLLQHGLEPNIRRLAVDYLFNKYVKCDINEFTENLYMTLEQAKEMREAGNEFGGHGSAHLWHALISQKELDDEITGSIHTLNQIGAPVHGGFYSYPFGSHNKQVCKAVADAGFRMGFTVEPTSFSLLNKDTMLISRFDTNDILKEQDNINFIEK